MLLRVQGGPEGAFKSETLSFFTFLFFFFKSLSLSLLHVCGSPARVHVYPSLFFICIGRLPW